MISSCVSHQPIVVLNVISKERYIFKLRIVEGRTLPGFVFGAASLDEEIYFNGGGYKIVDDSASGEDNGDTVFWVCSMTKMIAHVSPCYFCDLRLHTY